MFPFLLYIIFFPKVKNPDDSKWWLKNTLNSLKYDV